MDKNKHNTPSSQREEDRRSNESPAVKRAHTEAEKDMEADPELSAHSPNDDLDEGESARLGEKDNGVI